MLQVRTAASLRTRREAYATVFAGVELARIPSKDLRRSRMFKWHWIPQHSPLLRDLQCGVQWIAKRHEAAESGLDFRAASGRLVMAPRL
jgi:hypothetical protein